MPNTVDSDFLKRELMQFLDETFNKVDGIYLDKGTSLFETLASLDAERVSKPISPGATSIAGQVEHVRFYLAVMFDYMRGKWYEKLDWKQSWLVSEVTPDEWDDLLRRLREIHGNVISLIESTTDWSDERRLSGTIAVVAHTAYHLGAIRQMLQVVK